MVQKHYRKLFFRANKYQKKIIALAFLPAVIIIVFMWIAMEIFYRELVGVIVYQSSADAINIVNHWSGIIFAGFFIVLIGITLWAFSASLNMVGAFERLIRELDDVISGSSNKPLKARPKDELANGLLKRINVLIEHFQKK